MSGENRAFLKSLRGAVGVARAGRPGRAGFRGRMVPEWITNALGLIAMVVMISGGVSGGKALEGGGKRALLSVLAVLLALNLHSHLLKVLYQHPDLLAQALLPAARDWVFRRHLRMGLIRLVWVLPACAGVAWVVQAYGLGSEVPWWLAGAGGLALGAFTAALGVLALRWRHAALAYKLGWVGFVLAWIGGAFAPAAAKAQLFGWLNEYGDVLTGILPPGWFIGPGHRWLSGESRAWDWLWLLLPVVLLSLLPPTLRWMGQNFHFREAVLLEYASEVPAAFSDEDREAFAGQLERPPESGVTEVTDRILSREFLAPPPAPALGWLERLMWRWWTPRQRLLAEWDWAVGSGWTRAWKVGGFLLGGSLLLVGLGRTLGWAFLEWALPVGGGLGGLTLLPLLTGLSGGRLQSTMGLPVKLSEFGLMPRGVGETLATLNKAALIRVVAAVPLILPYAVLVALLLDRPWWLGVDFGLRACLVGWAITPVGLLARVANGTNDIRGLRLPSVLLLGWHLGCLVLLGGLLAAGFLSDSAWWCLAAVPPVAWVWERGYRWTLNRLWFDLMRRE